MEMKRVGTLGGEDSMALPRPHSSQAYCTCPLQFENDKRMRTKEPKTPTA